MRLVIVESPYAGDVERNLRYLRACLRDCLKRGEAPFASHGLYTVAAYTVVYTDLGISSGMRLGIEHAERLGSPVVIRALGPGWEGHVDAA